MKLLFILVEKLFHLTFLGFLNGVDKGYIVRKANKTNSHFVWSRCHVAINSEVEHCLGTPSSLHGTSSHMDYY